MGKGIPIGNLTSQLFANVYMNEFDQFVKHVLKVQNYARYTDDFVVVSGDLKYLESHVAPIQAFLARELRLELHPRKVTIRKLEHGVDFLGYIVLPHYRLLRTKTKRRILRKVKARIAQYRQGTISKTALEQSLQSYLGVLSHATAHCVTQELLNHYWYWLSE